MKGLITKKLRNRSSNTWWVMLLALVCWMVPSGIMAQSEVDNTESATTESRVAKVVFDKVTETITFTYDQEERDPDRFREYVIQDDAYIPKWSEDRTIRNAKAIIIDESFKDFRPKICNYWFYYCENAEEIQGLENLNTSEVTSMQGMFVECHFKHLDLTHFDTRNVDDMGSMFNGMTNITSLDLSTFNTENVRSFVNMFSEMDNITELDLHSFNTACALYATGMFKDCKNLEAIYVSDDFTTDRIYQSSEMFAGCEKLRGAIAWDENVVDKTHANYQTGYFTKWCRHEDANGVSTLVKYAEHEATCVAAAYTEYRCQLCNRIKSIFTGEPDPTKHTIVIVDAKQPTCEEVGNKMYYTCKLCKKAWYDAELETEISDEREITAPRLGHTIDADGNCPKCGVHIINLNGVTAEFVNIKDTEFKVENDGESTALVAKNPESYILGITLTSDKPFNMSFKVDLTDCVFRLTCNGTRYYNERNIPLKAGKNKVVFYASGGPNSIIRIENLTASVTDESSESTSGKAVYDKTSRTLTFYAREAVPEGAATVKIPELTDLPDGPWFNYYNTVEKVVIDPSFRTLRPKSCAYWFAEFGSLKEIEGMENLNTSETVNMANMFSWCTSLTRLDLTSMDTHNVNYMDYMFSGCRNLEEIYVSEKFSTANVKTSLDMFAMCVKLKGAISYDYSKTDAQYANTVSGYFLEKCSHTGDNGESLLVKQEDVAATCTKAAHTVYVCSKCHETIEADFVGEPDPTKHVLNKHEATATTCTSYGMEEYYDCAICKKLFADSDANAEIAKMEDCLLLPTGHQFDDNYTCSTCGVNDQRYKLFKTNNVKVIIINDNPDSYPWKVAEDSENMALESSNKEVDNTSSELTLLLDSDSPFKMSTAYMVSSEKGYDILTVSVDDNVKLEVSGGEEGVFSNVFNASPQILKLTYKKDHSSKDGLDVARIFDFVASTELTAEDVAPKPVAIIDKAQGTMTFKEIGIEETPSAEKVVLEVPMNRTTEDMGLWYNDIQDVKKVIFDKSFSKYKPTSLSYWLFGGYNIESIEGLENLNTSEVENFFGMFSFCTSLKSIDLSHINTAKAVSFGSMFNGCAALEELDLTSFDTKKVANTTWMFADCISLENIYVNKNFSMESIEESENMFGNCIYLNGARTYDPSFKEAEMANYHDGYLKTYYKVGNERHAICGDMNVEELRLEEGKPFMTHDAFTAKRATFTRVLADDNTNNVGTLCLPYAIEGGNGYTLYRVKEITNAEVTASENDLGTVVLEKVEGTLPAGVPAIFHADAKSVSFTAADADVVENPVGDDELYADGNLMRGAFTEYDVENGYVLRDTQFVSSSMVADENGVVTEAPLTAYITRQPDNTADRLGIVSTDGVFTAVDAVEVITNGKTQFYDLHGVRTHGLKRGVNIVRTDDGKVMKVVVK